MSSQVLSKLGKSPGKGDPSKLLRTPRIGVRGDWLASWISISLWCVVSFGDSTLHHVAWPWVLTAELEEPAMEMAMVECQWCLGCLIPRHPGSWEVISVTWWTGRAIVKKLCFLSSDPCSPGDQPIALGFSTGENWTAGTVGWFCLPLTAGQVAKSTRLV